MPRNQPNTAAQVSCRPHRYIPHPRQLMVLACRHCGAERPIKPKRLLYYNKRRRTYRVDENLHSLVAPVGVTAATAATDNEDVLQAGARRFQIYSNTSRYHITLAEGLALGGSVQGDILVTDPIRRALMTGSNQVRVVNVQLAPTHRGRQQQKQQRRQRQQGEHQHGGSDERLVLLQVKFHDPDVASAVQALHDSSHLCLLPQYPLHCALGVVQQNPSLSFSSMEAQLLLYFAGKVLWLDASHLALLRPSSYGPDLDKNESNV